MHLRPKGIGDETQVLVHGLLELPSNALTAERHWRRVGRER